MAKKGLLESIVSDMLGEGSVSTGDFLDTIEDALSDLAGNAASSGGLLEGIGNVLSGLTDAEETKQKKTSSNKKTTTKKASTTAKSTTAKKNPSAAKSTAAKKTTSAAKSTSAKKTTSVAKTSTAKKTASTAKSTSAKKSQKGTNP